MHSRLITFLISTIASNKTFLSHVSRLFILIKILLVIQHYYIFRSPIIIGTYVKSRELHISFGFILPMIHLKLRTTLPRVLSDCLIGFRTSGKS